MVKYPKIQTLFERDKNTFKVTPIFRNDWSIKPLTILREIIVEEKIDGTNCQVEIKKLPTCKDEVTISIYSRNNYISDFSIPYEGKQKLYSRIYNTVISTFSYSKLVSWYNGIFHMPYPTVRFFGEVYGKGIQKSNYLTSGTAFRLFDIQIENSWLSVSDRNAIANELNIPVVPKLLTLVDLSYESIYKKLFETHGKSIVAQKNGLDFELEGYILRPYYDLSCRGKRVIAKIKKKDF